MVYSLNIEYLASNDQFCTEAKLLASASRGESWVRFSSEANICILKIIAPDLGNCLHEIYITEQNNSEIGVLSNK